MRTATSAVRVVIAALGVLAACGDSPNGNDAARTVELTGDIAVYSDAVVLHLRQVDLPCDCANQWPSVGTCGPTTDFLSCDCGSPVPCVERVHLERDGVTVVDVETEGHRYAGSLMLNAELATPAELVITGCGGEARITIQHAPSVAPEFTLHCVDDDTAVSTWAPVDNTAVAMLAQSFEAAGQQCRFMDAGAGNLPMSNDASRFPPVDLEIQHSVGVAQTALGLFQLWSVDGVQGGWRIVHVPAEVSAGRRELPNASGTLNIAIDGTPDGERTVAIAATADLLAADPNATLELSAEAFGMPVRSIHLNASPSTDDIEVTLGTNTYRATVPHVVPSTGITMIPAASERYHLAFPSTVVGTQTLSFELSYNIGPLALPCTP